MKIYQGEPLAFEFNIKDDNDQYLPTLEGMSFEALLVYESGKKSKSWSTSQGTITLGVSVVGNITKGYASFGLSGTETADMFPGNYVYEMARVVDGNRAIGILKGAIIILPAMIRKGV